MFYRVDYLLGVMLFGLLFDFLCSRRLSDVSTSILARAYFAIVLVLLGLRLICFLAGIFLPQSNALQLAGGAVSDFVTLLFGALFGVAWRRTDARTLLSEPAVFSALCVGTAFSFALAGVGKTFSMEWMVNFFHQSGYSTAFLKCIITTEVFAALAMLLPATVLPAVFVLAVDMFGAIYTHLYNGDPLNDSAGAIVALVHLIAIAILWNMRPGAAKSRLPYVVIAAGAVACCLIAIMGGVLLHHTAHLQ